MNYYTGRRTESESFTKFCGVCMLVLLQAAPERTRSPETPRSRAPHSPCALFAPCHRHVVSESLLGVLWQLDTTYGTLGVNLSDARKFSLGTLFCVLVFGIRENIANAVHGSHVSLAQTTKYHTHPTGTRTVRRGSRPALRASRTRRRALRSRCRTPASTCVSALVRPRP